MVPEPKEGKGSVFTAIAVKVSSLVEVKRAYCKIRQLYPSAAHIMMGYDCQKGQGCHDNGECGAGLKLQQLLEDNNMSNKAIFVVRSLTGQKLGPCRFEIIQTVAKEALVKIK